ncbi:RlpA-like double-psi beta-barrel-protein domain-containing protein-containing protein [Phanerochaete sordida]|uniref:RlpA-like double-psi beta-barrel-protein domain-containing protein-containing protein n=1 Tax=Phanerochaete sordida TaxID=48140 RepID=A0A9P3LED7_9APHY|nr:RlpA-like double-psi beta-barrel-protein domain-containing protein-containing protein [Phanerochaete sordida]
MFAKLFALAALALAASAASLPEKRSAKITGTHSGDGTFYATGLGACGITNDDGDHIAAASHVLFDSFPGYKGGNPNANPICGRKATAKYQGKSVTVTITDRCEACKEWDLDFSPAAFDKLADEGVGRLHGVTWHFN